MRLLQKLHSIRDVPGSIFMISGTFLFSIQDILIKLLGRNAYPLFQITLYRSFGAIITIFIIIIITRKRVALVCDNVVALVGRSLVQVFSYTCYFLGIASLPYGNAIALSVTSPIWVVLFGTALMGESLGWKRLSYVIIGFSGALLIALPDSGVFQIGSVFSLLSAISYAVQQLLARRLGSRNSAIMMVLIMHITQLSVAVYAGVFYSGGISQINSKSLIFLSRSWKEVTAADGALMLSCGMVHAIGSIMIVRGYIVGPANNVAPFEYVGLLWAVGWGYLIWAEMPTVSSLSGMLIIGLMGILLMRRNRSVKG